MQETRINADRQAKKILTAIRNLRSALGEASITCVLRKFSPDQIRAIRDEMRDLFSSVMLFSSALAEVEYGTIKDDEGEGRITFPD